MRKALKVLSVVVVVAMMGVAAAMAGQNEIYPTRLFEDGDSVTPVACGNAGSTIPIIVAENTGSCPGGVYCEHSSCGDAFCCPWGYFYSNGCTCECYKSSYDAGADCSSYFRCN